MNENGNNNVNQNQNNHNNTDNFDLFSNVPTNILLDLERNISIKINAKLSSQNIHSESTEHTEHTEHTKHNKLLYLWYLYIYNKRNDYIHVLQKFSTLFDQIYDSQLTEEQLFILLELNTN